MMQQLADRIRDPIRQRYRATPLPEFFAWWGRELSQLVPDRVKRRLMQPKPQLWLIAGADAGDDVAVWRVERDARALDIFGASEDIDLLRARWRDLLGGFEDDKPEIRLCLPDDYFLELPVELPLAVENNLGQAISFQLDQLSPFRADQVMLDHAVRSKDVEHNRLNVELRIVPNEAIDGLLERLAAIGIQPHVVDTLASQDPPLPEGFNLLPEQRRPRYVHGRARFNAMLAGGLVVVLALVMVQSILLRERTVDQLQAEADRLRGEAREIVQLQQQLEDSLLAANFLTERSTRLPATIEILDEVTRLLPNDIWLQRFQLRDQELTVQGLAEGAQRVVGLLNESELLDQPEISGTINIDPVTGKERFMTNARIVPNDRESRASPAREEGS